MIRTGGQVVHSGEEILGGPPDAASSSSSSFVVWGFNYSCCEGFGTFGFDVHHRYSDKMKGILDVDGLPEKGSVDYYATMAHRDHLLRGRHLAATTTTTPAPLTFSGGNETYNIASFGYLYYANVTVGSPGLWFLVALDTGSDLFWLPCNCTSCITSLKTASGQVVELNIYNPNTSSSEAVSCNSTFCEQPRQCSSRRNTCVYQIQYLSNDTSSTGLMVEDILHLTTDDSQLKVVDAQVPLGCGIVETGAFLEGLAPNGLFGLGMNDISVPSVLANKGLTANSFSMCFGTDGYGRMNFGDTGSSGQGQTPFNVEQSNPTYNVTVTQVSVGNNVTNISFTAIFDSGTSFTNLNDPSYTIISEMFDSQANETRHSSSDSQIPFEYCYDLSSNQSSLEPPPVNLTMKGGDQFYVIAPTVIVSLQNGGHVYCLALVKSWDINIIGQNFMTGYSIVFDRENMVLGWEASNCYGTESSAVAPAALSPEAPSIGSPISSLSPPNDSTLMKSSISTLFAIIFTALIHCWIIGSS
ncbi:hypothetical protein Vadar_034387 [Vaccinium darrowii]|uniref:Uncharacterized protein n=1 Tax=Vaccinium darrowii TaxID=229202 RepID=A0ACB7YB80_9ERIC|nr:hypothetical protein Vadar_034387 [Vaccinium darrowii]